MYETVKKKIKESEGFSNRGYFLKYKGADGQDIQEDFMQYIRREVQGKAWNVSLLKMTTFFVENGDFFLKITTLLEISN